MDTEIWLLSARDVVPNLIFTLYRKPKKVRVFYTEWEVSKERAQGQKLVFERYGINCSTIEIKTYDHENITETLNSLQVNPEKVEFLANVATKYTVEVIHRWLTERGGKSLYYMPDGTVALFGGEKLYRIKEKVLKTEDFFNVAGLNIESVRPFKEMLGEKYQAAYSFYKNTALAGRLNDLRKNSEIHRIEASLFKKLSKEEMKIVKKKGWILEFLTYAVLEQSGLFHEVLSEIEINYGIGEKRELKNEIDITAVRNNTLYYFSCKSGKLTNLNLEDHAFRVGSLARRIGGRFTVPILVTSKELPQKKKEKVKLFGVVPLTIKELLELENNPSKLEEWEKIAHSYR
ncbi:Card1-like endonuclease domain-containing protein [Thermovibrio ammonificans]